MKTVRSCSRFAWQISQGIGKQHFQLNGRQYPLPVLHLLRIRATVVRLACVKWTDKLHRPPGYLIGWILKNLDFFFSAKGSFKLEDKSGALSSHSVGSILGWTTFKLCLGFLILNGRSSTVYATWLLWGLRKAIYRAHRMVPDARNSLISGGYFD